MSTLFILDANGIPKPELSAQTWAQFMKNPDNLVIADTDLGPRGVVITTFLGQDGRRKKRGGPNQFGQVRSPLLWECRVHGGAYDGHATRHTDRADALNGHSVMVRVCKGEL